MRQNTIQEIYRIIAENGFSESVLQMIDNYINEILYGTTSFSRFNLPEHAGLCSAGSVLIGASIITDYARTSLTASCNASSSKGSSPTNWEIDELQEQLVEQWAPRPLTPAPILSTK